MKAFDFNWNIGEPWGVAHPDHACYASAEEVYYSNGIMYLGISMKPAMHHGRRYMWAIGKVSSEEVVKYGTMEVVFQLPLGRRLWPAIWLYDAETWPPEIDVMEAWSGQGLWPLQGRSDYLRLPWAQNIHPSLIHPEGLCGSYGTVGNKGVWRWQIDTYGLNKATLVWTPDEITVKYNGYTVMSERRAEVLEAYNKSHGMRVILNNYVDNAYTYDDYTDLRRRDFKILDVKYRQLGQEGGVA